jgi:hypothetical protein
VHSGEFSELLSCRLQYLLQNIGANLKFILHFNIQQ